MPSVEADVTGDSSVESDSGGDNPQDEESFEDASAEDCVGDNESFQVNTILYVVVERLYCACTYAERAKSREESQGLNSYHSRPSHSSLP